MRCLITSTSPSGSQVEIEARRSTVESMGFVQAVRAVSITEDKCQYDIQRHLSHGCNLFGHCDGEPGQRLSELAPVDLQEARSNAGYNVL